MTHVYPEYGIIVALLCVLLAIGIPAFYNGRWILGGIVFVIAGVIAAWALIAYLRQRRGD